MLSEYIVKNRGIVPSSAKDALENYRQVCGWLQGPGWPPPWPFKLPLLCRQSGLQLLSYFSQASKGR